MSKAPSRKNGVGNLRFLTYTCIAWGLPMIYVGSCFLLDNFQVVGIGYGDEEACWLTKGNAKIVVFLTPIACALLYNVAAFSQTIWAINTARKQTNRVKAKSTRRDSGAVVKVYIRLLTLMGFTWFFCFHGWAHTQDDDLSLRGANISSGCLHLRGLCLQDPSTQTDKRCFSNV